MKKAVLYFLVASCISWALPVFAQSIDPGTGVKLTANKSYFPVWSPDGRWIAGCGGFDGVWITPAAGGDSEKLAGKSIVTYNGQTTDFMITRKMGFTPDSREVIYTTYIIDESRGTEVSVWKTAGGWSIDHEIPVLMAVDIQTKQTRVIREEAEFGRYSQSGRFFGYINYDHRAVTDPPNAAHHYSLAVYDSVTKETRYLTDGLGAKTRSFSFNADESSVVAEIEDTNNTSGMYRIFVVPLDGGAPKDISWYDNPWNLKYFMSPEYSPDGRWILYTGWTAGANDVRMLLAYDTVSGKTTSVFPATAVWNTYATWSPDGKKFCCQLELKSTSKGALYVYDFNSADLGVSPELAEVPLYIPREYGKKLVDFSLDSISREDSVKYAAYSNLDAQFSPSWSPDGRNIAFVSRISPAAWTVSSDGGMPTLVANYNRAYDYKGYKITLDNPFMIRYAPDGKKLVFPSWIIDESRGTKVTITEGSTPTGSHFGYSISDPINVIKEVDIETGETGVVLDSAAYPVYSHNGRFLAYSTSPGYSLALYDTVTRESKVLNTSRSTPYCFSPDDSFLVASISSSGIYRFPLDGRPAEMIFSGSYRVTDISPDGSLMLFEGTVDGKSGLFVYEFKTGVQYPFLVDNPDFAFSEGKFSPDGKKVCYTLTCRGAGNWIHSYVCDFNPSDVGIQVAVAESAPAPFALTGNHPNPFNPSTTIGFSLDAPGKVQLFVYSLTGQKVRELISNRQMEPGRHSVVWDGRDESGKRVSSGVYFTRLTRDARTTSAKMTLLK